MNFLNQSKQESFEHFSPTVMSVFILSNMYSDIHGWLSSIICILGIVLNAFNVIFLHKSKSDSCSVNSILISIALCDSIIMAVYLPFSVHFYIFNSNSMFTLSTPERDTLFWSSYSLVGMLLCVTFHSISTWLTVYLSVYRYLYMKKSISLIKSKTKSNQGSVQSTKTLNQSILLNSNKSIFIICLFCVIFCLPSFFYPIVSKQLFHSNITSDPYKNESSIEYIYLIKESKLNSKNNNSIFSLSFYLQAFFGKIIPSLCLAVFIVLIIKYLRIIRNNKKNIINFKVSC